MPVSIPPIPPPYRSATSATAPTASASSTSPTRLPSDEIINYTYTYGYNFGYIANGLALIEARKEEAATSLPSISTSLPSTSNPTLTTPSTSSTNQEPASTKFSLTFPPTSQTGTFTPSEPLLPPAPSVHPFSPYYGAYIELVASEGYSNVDKFLEEQDEKAKSTTRPKTKIVPLNSKSINTATFKEPQKPQRLNDSAAPPTTSALKRKARSQDRDDDIGEETRTAKSADEMEGDGLDYFSLSKKSAKKVRITKDVPMAEAAIVGPFPENDTELSPPSTSSGSTTSTGLFTSLLGPSTTGTWATTPSLIFTPGSGSGSGHGTASREEVKHASGSGPAVAVKSYMRRSLSPADSAGSMGGMVSLELLEMPRTPGVFTQSFNVHKERGKERNGVMKEPRPRGLWRARGTGPLPPLPPILNMNAGEKGKLNATTTSSDIHDRTTNTRDQASTLATSTTFPSTSASIPFGFGFESGSRQESRHRETTGYDYCSSSYSSCSSDDMSDGGNVVKNLKRRRARRSRRDRGAVRVDGGDGGEHSDSGSCSSSSDCSTSSLYSTTSAAGKGKTKRRRELGGFRNGEDDGAVDDQKRRHHHADQRQQQHDQSRKTLSTTSDLMMMEPATSLSTMATTTTAAASTHSPTLTTVIPQADDFIDATKYFTRSKVMDTTSLARSRSSDDPTPLMPLGEPPAGPQVTYEDWEDLKEVWGRCLEVIDVEEPEETLPLLRGIIHECGRFLQAYEDPSVLILSPPAPPEDPPLKVDAGISTDPIPPTEPSILPKLPPPPKSPTFVHPKDLPTAFHTLLGTALFFFGNLISEAPHLALEGEPQSKAFYHLYALDVFEMGENVPARTGVAIHNDDSPYTNRNSNDTPLRCQDDCCSLGSKEDWRMSVMWGRAVVSLAEELLERERICEEWLAGHPQPETVAVAEPERQFNYGRPTYFGMGVAPPRDPDCPNPAAFLSEDFVAAGGVMNQGYFSGTGGRGMGFKVDGMGALRVAHSGMYGSEYSSLSKGLELPSAIYPLSTFKLADFDGDKTPIVPQFPQAMRGDTSTPTSLNFPRSSEPHRPQPPRSTSSKTLIPQARSAPLTPSDDPRRHWKKDSPFVIIWNRMPPVTRRTILGGTHGSTCVVNDLPTPSSLAPSETATFSMSWWNSEDAQPSNEGNGRHPVNNLWGDETGDDDTELRKKRKPKKTPGASVDEMMGIAVDHLSRGLFHMPRTRSATGGLGGVGGIAGGSVELASGRPNGKSSHAHGHKHKHHHHHHRRHRKSDRELSRGVGGVQPFSRASHLLTIAMEVLMLAEKLPNADSRYRWASHADSVFEQMRLEESPGVIRPARREQVDAGMDVDFDLAVGPASSSSHDLRRDKKKRKKPYSRTIDDSVTFDSPLHLYPQRALHAGAMWLDSHRNEVILKARGRCSLIIGSAVAEEKIEAYLDDEEQLEGSPSDSTSMSPAKRREEVVRLLKSEDAEEARGRLREAIDFLERARAVWNEGVSARSKEREHMKERAERERRMRMQGPGSDYVAKDKSRSGSSGVSSPPPRRRGIGALAAESKKRRREMGKQKSPRESGSAAVVAEDAPMDIDVEMGDVTVHKFDVDVSPSASPPLPSSSGSQSQAPFQGAEEEAIQLFALFAEEEAEEQQEEKEYARLIAEAVVTLANILLVAEEGDEELGLVTSHDYAELGSEKEREELYAKAKEEMKKAGIEEVDDMI